MNESLALVDYAVIVVFFAVMIGVGLFYARRQKSSDEFFGGDKSVPWYLAGVSYYMGSFSALAFVMYSALAYRYGWIPVTLSWLNVPVVLLVTWLFALKWRRAVRSSPLEFLDWMKAGKEDPIYVDNMLVKYHTIVEAWKLAHGMR